MANKANENTRRPYNAVPPETRIKFLPPSLSFNECTRKAYIYKITGASITGAIKASLHCKSATHCKWMRYKMQVVSHIDPLVNVDFLTCFLLLNRSSISFSTASRVRQNCRICTLNLNSSHHANLELTLNSINTISAI